MAPSTTIDNEVFMMQKEQHPQLTPAAEFERSGRCPVNLRWLIFSTKKIPWKRKGQLLDLGKEDGWSMKTSL